MLSRNASSSMTYCESVHLLPCEGERLVAILSEPTSPTYNDLGVVIIVGGPQYRAGSHRQFVHLARTLATAGVCSLRFDVRGMGDSTGAQRSFEHLTADTGAAIDALMSARPNLRRVALWGLCDGASAALLYLDESGHDSRVQALLLLNPWVRSAATLAAMHLKHYYTRRLLQREFWGKLLHGQVAGLALRELVRSVGLMLRRNGGNLQTEGAPSPTPYPQRMARAWARFEGQVLLVLSGNDYTAKEFLEAWGGTDWLAVRSHWGLQQMGFAEADHTFSQMESQNALESRCVEWLHSLPGAGKVQVSISAAS